jgi:thioredoxin reductase (NADPH)
MIKKYDVVIIGGGPAGLTAGLYTSRARLKSLLIDKGMVGGMIADAERVENYPGFPEGISGLELCQLMEQQSTKFGLEILLAEVTGIKLQKEQKVVTTTEGNLLAKAVIVAGGSKWRKLGVPGEEEFTGKGVSYCATCDAPFFKDQSVALVGGGNAAITEALQLAKVASKVTVIHRRRQLRATRIMQERAFSEPKIKFRWDSVVGRIEGDDFVKKIRLRHVKTGEESALKVAGIFIAIGFKPETDYLKETLSLDSAGQILTNEKMETKVPGIFAAGDIRSNSIRQVIAAAGDGATAAFYAEKFIAE